MDLVGAYGDSDSDRDHEDEKIPIPASSMTINATPHVDTDLHQHPYVVGTNVTSLIHNPTVTYMIRILSHVMCMSCHVYIGSIIIMSTLYVVHVFVHTCTEKMMYGEHVV